MAAEVLPDWLRKDMLLLADRGFYSFKLWRLAAGSGAALLWRRAEVSATSPVPCAATVGELEKDRAAIARTTNLPPSS